VHYGLTVSVEWLTYYQQAIDIYQCPINCRLSASPPTEVVTPYRNTWVTNCNREPYWGPGKHSRRVRWE